jgi:hypothetical protein
VQCLKGNLHMNANMSEKQVIKAIKWQCIITTEDSDKYLPKLISGNLCYNPELTHPVAKKLRRSLIH